VGARQSTWRRATGRAARLAADDDGRCLGRPHVGQPTPPVDQITGRTAAGPHSGRNARNGRPVRYRAGHCEEPTNAQVKACLPGWARAGRCAPSQVVALKVGGSSPLGHPSQTRRSRPIHPDRPSAWKGRKRRPGQLSGNYDPARLQRAATRPSPATFDEVGERRSRALALAGDDVAVHVERHGRGRVTDASRHVEHGRAAGQQQRGARVP
jgi:hypothetical protein